MSPDGSLNQQAHVRDSHILLTDQVADRHQVNIQGTDAKTGKQDFFRIIARNVPLSALAVVDRSRHDAYF